MNCNKIIIKETCLQYQGKYWNETHLEQIPQYKGTLTWIGLFPYQMITWLCHFDWFPDVLVQFFLQFSQK